MGFASPDRIIKMERIPSGGDEEGGGRMRMTLESTDESNYSRNIKATVEFEGDDLSFDELCDMFKGCAYSMTYAAETIEEGYGNED